MHRTAEDAITWGGPAVVQGRDPLYVVASFAEVRNAGASCDCARARVISGQTQLDVSAITFHELLEVANTRVHVLLRIEGVDYVQLSRRLRHQLHQSHRSLAGNRVGI